MFLHERRIHSRLGIDGERGRSHLGDLLHDDGMVNCLVRRLSPCERPVILDQNTRSMDGIQTGETADDDVARLLLIIPFDFFPGHGFRTGNIAVEIVGVRRPQARNIPAGLRPSRREGRMRVHHAANLGESAVEAEMGRGVAGGTEMALDNIPR